MNYLFELFRILYLKIYKTKMSYSYDSLMCRHLSRKLAFFCRSDCIEMLTVRLSICLIDFSPQH